ncbi:putative two-component system sensor kinase PhoR [Gordonia polyisoprenivorans VH2]|uniref:histidine kinase n=1 Tax=Gordonia polyisoprenivorans (strain DSM 44266 / VH2) TaxID=1112204 RepID=H6MU01_GORPV|nr:HAMP domain-containing sensor histidine kinase [Gordonia polyisoprenivorans]AFA75232.1 putative two-component system sensor kinase PhoR [Gordonia polyisoprenivorans VH2]HCS57207.1 sensor histidine kinase [Gordonia polyisoprenivorans]
MSVRTRSAAPPADPPAGAPAAPPATKAAKIRTRGVPLRISLVALTMVLVAFGLLVSGIAVTSAMRSDLLSRTDQGLVSAVGTWAKPRNPDMDQTQGPPIGPRRPPSSFFVMTTLNSGQVISNANDFTHTPDLSGLPDGNVSPTTVGSQDGDGPQWRVIKHIGPDGVSVVAVPLSDVNKTLSRLMWLQFGIGAAVVVVLGVLSYLVVRSSLRPLRRVEETAHAIAAGNLNMRVAPGPPNTEVGSLSASLNTMLGQIQHAFATTAASEQQARHSEEKMRRFVADASHELRTPLTSIKGFAELFRQGAVADPGDAMRRIDDEAGRMKLLVEDLLMLARLDAHRPLNSEPVDMLMLAADTVQASRAAAPDREIRLQVSPSDEPPVVRGDSARLVQVIRNLVNNAVVHTPPEATITVGVGVLDGVGDVLVTVTDTGQGLTPDERSHVFERFYRGDSSRSRGEGGGSGLGLSIVAALVDAQGGRVGVDSTPGEGACFWVRLPRLAD